MSNHEEKASTMKRLQAKMKRLMKKRWAMPALYLALAAIVVTAFIWFTGFNEDQDIAENQDSQFDINDDSLEDTLANEDEEAVPVTSTNETFQLPVLDENEVAVVGTFFDYESSTEDQVNSLVRYNNYYYQNKGIDLASEEGESFDVTAAMSGTVIKAEDDALFGQVVHIEHDEDVVTIYQSLDGVLVEVGQTVKQGDVIARAGRNLYNSEAGTHVHFELRKNGLPVDPLDYMGDTMAALPNMSDEEIAGELEAEELPDVEEAQSEQTDEE